MRGSWNSTHGRLSSGSRCVYQDASAVEHKVKELQDRVGHLMIVIVDHVTPKNEGGGKEAVVKAAKGIEADIKELIRCGLRVAFRDGW